MNYFIEISIDQFQPDCWRLIRVSEHHNLYDIHQIIQASFNWPDSNTFSFHSEHRDFAPADYELPIPELGLSENDAFTYHYDESKEWSVQFVLREIQEDDSNPLPLCVDGQVAAPYIEFNGPHEFKKALAQLSSVSQEFDEEMVDRLQQWDPEAFGVDFVNLLLYYRLAGFPSGSTAFPPIQDDVN